MADLSKKLKVIETYHVFRHNDAVKIARKALKEVKGNKNAVSVTTCIEFTGNNYKIFSSFSDDRPRLGSTLVLMGFTKMGFALKE